MYQVDFILFDEAAKAPETETAIPLAKSPHAVVYFTGDTKQCRPNRTGTNDDSNLPATQSAYDAFGVDRITHIAEQVNQSFESSDEEPVCICGQMINDACNTLATSPSLGRFTKVRPSTVMKVLVTNNAVYQTLLKIANGLRRPTFIPIINSMIGQKKGLPF
ncbi:unnamed protein product [Clonostachys rhizophaga]|uniref:Uncharacterized protein n=1 Tax=Clonostachys rhizophaga TaxID=160324 RepID=A0A9N9V8U3_9HYPO|nr:unnamed protein product [Clonostachys rhizophaga]